MIKLQAMTKKFYLTTAIPYVNAAPHIGHALEFIQADCIRRYHKLLDEDVLLLSGADENSLKNVQAAEKEEITPQELCNKYSRSFQELAKTLNISFDIFQRSTDEKHFKSSQKLWQLCKAAGAIYKKPYTGLYCVGCEAFYTEDELEDGLCPEHKTKPEKVSEENWFFSLKKYEPQIKKLIESGELKIIPETRKNEVLGFIKGGLEDFSISRSVKRARGWGVPVPDDPDQIMYVWFDALNIYQSGVGFNWDENLYKKWWPADLHIIGKGILRFHAVYWPAILLAAGLSLPKSIFIHGYLTIDGQKMSKSLGNVVDPFELVKKYGVDAVRYYFLREIPSYGDGDFSERRFKEVYNADLANGLGNLVARVAKLCETVSQNYSVQSIHSIFDKKKFPNTSLRDYEERYVKSLESFSFNEALTSIWGEIKSLDEDIERNKPWQYTKDPSRQETICVFLLESAIRIKDVAKYLKPFLPKTAKKIQKQFTGPKIVSGPSLFPRL